MIFETDLQTMADLNIPGKFKPDSILGQFNIVKTSGGEKLLEQMFGNPLTEAAQINKRAGIFHFFGQLSNSFPFDTEKLTLMELYLETNSAGILSSASDVLKKRFTQFISVGEDYETIEKGVYATISILHSLNIFLTTLEKDFPGNVFQYEAREATSVLASGDLQAVLKQPGSSALSLTSLIRYNHLFLNTYREAIGSMLHLIWHLDVYMAVSEVARKNGFNYAQAFSEPGYGITINGCRHPGIKSAAGNFVFFRMDKNVIFLTGANMAGKSTLMKAVGIAVYLAHMGFPVAATSMQFAVLDGLYTSINVPDNLQLGYSHFYAEVHRVKTVADRVSKGKRLLVIFDELFKGTNVKDAFDATLAVISEFSAYRNCYFIVSTHIIEVAEELKKEHDNMQFVYLPAIMENGKPCYTYTLEGGITADRHGMLIIENEQVIDLIKGII